MDSISLFSGAGGLDIGLESEEFVTRVFVENDLGAQRTLAANREYWRDEDAKTLGDITELSPERLLKAAGLGPGAATLLAGGPPCQSFSTAGRRASVSDPRGGLFANFVTMVEGTQPRFFAFENVRGLLSAAIRHRPLELRGPEAAPLDEDEELGSLLKRVLLPELRERLKYEVVYGLANAADYGTPQTRQRVIFLGSRDREFGTDQWPDQEMPLAELMPPTHARDETPDRARWRDLRWALDGLNGRRQEFIAYSRARKAIYRKIPAGKNWRHLRDRHPAFLEEAMGGALHATGGRVGFWRRLTFDRPCPTVSTSPIQKGTGLCHPRKLRPLSVREYARVQEFPDDYELTGTLASRYRQIGNAVPVGLGRAIGRALRAVIASSDAEPPEPSGVHTNGTTPVTV